MQDRRNRRSENNGIIITVTTKRLYAKPVPAKRYAALLLIPDSINEFTVNFIYEGMNIFPI
jgi:hypothetical protein